MIRKFFPLLALLAFAAPAAAQPAFTAAPPLRGAVVNDGTLRRAQYAARIKEILDWQTSFWKPADPPSLAPTSVAIKLARHEDPAGCSRSVIEQMRAPAANGPFWMFPVISMLYHGRGQLTPAAVAAIREAWRVNPQVRGDTENHWMMYYASLYLMAQYFPGEPASSWYTGKSSAENFAEARDYLLHWMDLTTTIGQGEFNPSGYISEYAIPLAHLLAWADDPAMRQRAHILLDWLFADLAASSLDGVLTAPNSRTIERTVAHRWDDNASFFNWLLFGHTPPTASYGGFGLYYAPVAHVYDVPEVLYRIATDRAGRDTLQRDYAHTRRRWRHSDELYAPIYRTRYLRPDYAVGSYQGGLADPIQTHVWGVQWSVPDPRPAHNTLFSLHPYASAYAMRMYFCSAPEAMMENVPREGKPSYDSPDKILGSSPYEQVFQDLDTIVALYDIAPDTHYPQVNGFFSKDLAQVTEDPSGWIFARGGDTWLAYRPLAPYRWEPCRGYQQIAGTPTQEWMFKRTDPGDKLLVSPHLKNGTIVQAAAAREYPTLAAFAAAIRALPLEFSLTPTPTVKMKTLRGKTIAFTYGQTPALDGRPIDYAAWKLYEGPWLNAEKNTRILHLTHGSLERILDYNTLTITDHIRP